MSVRRSLLFLVLASALLLTGGSAELAVAAPDTPQIYSSLNFDGVNDYVEVPHASALNPTTAFTIELWVRSNTIAGCDTLVAKDYLTAYWLGLCNGRIRFYGSGSGSSLDGNTVIDTNVWTHVAVVYKSSGRQYFINGELDYTNPFSEVMPTTNTQAVRIGLDHTCCAFDGRMSNVRFWNVARTQEQIRRWMHVSIGEPLPGLVANWRLDGDANDALGNHNGTLNGAGFLLGNPPAQPAFVPVDEFFNTLPLPRFAAATAYIPDLDRVMLIGGQTGTSAITSNIAAVDAGSGDLTNQGNLPQLRTDAAAVYVPTTDTVYAFGGRFGSSSVADTIYGIDPTLGSATVLSATLPMAVHSLAAVYDDSHDKVYLFGGRSTTGDVDTILIFDPATESISAASFTLPQPLQGIAAARTGGRILLFGGKSSGIKQDTIYEVTIADDGINGSVAPLAAVLPSPEYYLRVAVDPQTQLVYLVDAYLQDWLWIFDPFNDQLWKSQIGLPNETDRPSVVYSPANRHMLIIGGSYSFTYSRRNVWRIPLGDGPMVPLGHWDFPLPVGAQVNAIDGDEDKVLIATNGNGAYAYRSDGARSQYSPAGLGSASGVVNDVAYRVSDGTIYIGTNDAGVKIIDSGGGITTYNNFGLSNDNNVLSVDAQSFYGTDNEGLWWRRFIAFPPPGFYTWYNNFPGQRIANTAPDSAGDLWLIADNSLKKLDYALFGGTETNYGSKCSLSSFADQMDLLVAPNGDWWIVSPGDGEFAGAGICRIPAAATPGTGGSLTSLLGNQAMEIDVDADDRIWIPIKSGSRTTGGLSIFGYSGPLTDTIRTTELNWQNAPLGSLNLKIDPITSDRFWDSSLTAAGAADERVWTGDKNGRLVTLAQRWQQIDEANNIGGQVIQNVWTERGRAFLATSNTLYVLQPDGKTWDSRNSIKVWDMLADSQGRIWAATNNGIRLFTPTGWDYLTDKEGDRPSTATYALAEDRDGRIWIGGLHGLTLFDRDRFVATFDDLNSPLPDDRIRALFVDSDNRLWVGTDLGLARLDGATWTNFTTADGLPSNDIFAISQIGSGDVAISTFSGLSFYDGSNFSTQSLPIPDSDLPLSVDEHGRLWAGNAVLRNGAWEVYYTTDSGLASDEVSDSAADGADRIWFSHAPDQGVSVRGTFLPPLANVVPSISNIPVKTGRAGDIITIEGSGFGSSRGGVRVTIGQAPADVRSVSPTQIEVELTENNTSGDVSVQIGGRRSTASDAFCTIPTIDSFSPTGGNDGVLVNIYGRNFDPTATVYLDNSNPHTPHIRGATWLGTFIEPGDASGTVRVVNDCPVPGISDPTVTGYSSALFQRITLTMERMVLNQGIQSTGLVAGRPTLFQHYLSASPLPRATDAVEIDTIELTFTEGSNPPFTISQEYAAAVPTSGAAPAPALLRDITNSVNVVMAPNLQGSSTRTDVVLVQATMKRRTNVIAQGSTSDHFRSDRVIRVLLVPITDNTPTAAELNNLRNNTNAGLDNLRRRIFPTGRVELYWSPISYTADDVLMFDNSSVNIGNAFDLYDASHNLERARRWWNNHREPDVLIAYGVVDPAVNNSSTVIGQGFWPDTAQLLNGLGLSVLDTLCDIGGAAVSVLTFGLAGGGCDLEVPLYVGWGISTTDSSDLIGHEMGHIMGLVKPWARNGSVTDNFSHSVNDEIDGGECGSIGMTYNVNKTLYRQPGVIEPVVNPLTAGQFMPQLNITATTTFLNPTRTVTSEALVPRAKAIMSYACRRNNNNVFFEPVDVPAIMAEYAITGARGFFDDLTPLAATSTAAGRIPATPLTGPTPIPAVGDRIYVSGIVTATTNTGIIRQVEIMGQDAPLDASYTTGFWLVQKDGAGVELGRTGVFPVSRTSEGTTDAAFFAATLLAQSGVAQIDLLQDTMVLDSFSAGSSVPTVSIGSPSGGTYSSGNIPVVWTASDGDGDNLNIAILYSPDAGTTWTPVGFSDQDSGSQDVPVELLAGSSDARMKIVANDGFHSGEAVSAPFKVTDQPPLPFIGAPLEGSTYLEGRALTLSGGATDNQDLNVSGANLLWSSDRDGDLGSGELLNAFLSVGTHTITLEATNSKGLTATAVVTVTVAGDYDMDGISDAAELGGGLNLLSSADAGSDGDGDGLPLLMELNRGLNPAVKDSDGDGRDDDVEVADGTDPLTADSPLAADTLSAYPNSLTFDADLALDVPMPQDLVELVSREPVSWTLTADVNWLAAMRVTGKTPDGTTIIVNTDRLPGNGVHTGNLFFDSSLGRVTVPVTVNASNVSLKIYLPVITR